MKRFLNGIILIVVDISVYYIALISAYYLRTFISGQVLFVFFQRPESVQLAQFTELYWIPIVFIVFYLYEGIYSAKRPFWLDLKSMLKAVVLSTFAIYAFLGFSQLPASYSRFVILITGIIWFVLSAGAHNVVQKLLYRLGFFAKHCVLVGNSRFFRLARKSLHEVTYLNYRVKAWVSSTKVQRVPNNVVKYNFSEKINWKKIADKHPYLVVSEKFAQKRRVLVQELLLLFDEIFIIPDKPLEGFINTDLLFLFSAKVFLRRVRNNLKSVWSQFIKKLFDKVVGTIIFVFSLPTLALVSLAIILDSKGPPFIEKDNPARDRIGKNNKDFSSVKFRTMIVDKAGVLHKKLLKIYFDKYPDEKQNWKIYKKIKGKDPRVTRIGRILRTTSLDSLSEIVNVVKGDMSLVGPRPYLPRERPDMQEYIDTIVSIKPGMTGLWQISGRTELTFEDRMKLDIWYIHNWSLWLDIVILLKTFGVVVSKVGAR